MQFRKLAVVAVCLTFASITAFGCSKKKVNPSLDSSAQSTAQVNNGKPGILITDLKNGYGFTLPVGGERQISVEIRPKNATDKTVKWSTSDQSIASINPDTGLIKAKSAGTVTVTVEALDGSGVKDTCTVSVVSGTKKWEKTPNRKIQDRSIPYYLYFEKDAFTVSVYGQGDDGYYSDLVKTISSSRGRTINMTPTGIFKISKQKRWYQFSIGKYWTQYCIRYTGDIYLHGPLYKNMAGDTMYINEYNQIGTASTSGCLAMVTQDIKWIWDNCPDGTTLEIAAGSPVCNVAPAPRRIPSDGPAIDPTDPLFKKG